MEQHLDVAAHGDRDEQLDREDERIGWNLPHSKFRVGTDARLGNGVYALPSPFVLEKTGRPY